MKNRLIGAKIDENTVRHEANDTSMRDHAGTITPLGRPVDPEVLTSRSARSSQPSVGSARALSCGAALISHGVLSSSSDGPIRPSENLI